MIALSTRPRLVRGVRLQADRVRGGVNLLAPEHVLRVNDSSAAIIGLCDGQRSVAEIVDALSGRYQADRVRIERETIALLEDLAARRAIAW